MNKTLTLQIDEHLLEKASEYAALQKKSLTDMIESYLKSLASDYTSQEDNEIEISSYVKSLRTGVEIPDNLNEKESYIQHVYEKYQ